jgi:molybdopterin-guanine dinucleotide biosynthesis protein A
VLAGMDWAAEHAPEAEFVLSVAADCPFLPNDLAVKLESAREAASADICVAHSGGQAHPVIALWRVALRDELRHALVEENMRKIDRWTARYRMASVEWPSEPVDPFFNANTPEDIAEAERLLSL